jgi:Tfp pilus assembly protein PilN
MINLLPEAYANNIRYGRHNTVLRNWLLGVMAAILGMALIVAGGWLYINQQSKTLQTNLDATNQELKAQNLDKVKQDAKEITGDIRVINKVLSTEIRFSDLIKTIGNDMPPGTVLGALSLTQADGTLDLTTKAKDYNSAAQIAVNLSDPKNKLFSKVDILTINCQSFADPNAYSCSATFKALFSPQTKNRFLSVPKDTQ